MLLPAELHMAARDGAHPLACAPLTLCAQTTLGKAGATARMICGRSGVRQLAMMKSRMLQMARTGGTEVETLRQRLL